MNKQEYLRELYQRLKPLPLTPEDANDAMRFYEEYFDEAGPEREQEVIAELGSPAYVAAQAALKLTGSLTPARPTRKRDVNMLVVILGGIFAAPVALPLAVSAAAVVGSLLFAALCAAVGFGLGGALTVVMGAGAVLHAATLFFTADFATAVYFMGSGLFTVGMGALMARFGWWLCAVTLKGAKDLCARFFNKIRKNENPDKGGQYA